MSLGRGEFISLIGRSGFFFFQAEDGIRDYKVTGVQTCALPIVENAIRHGVEPSAHGGKLQVRTERRGDLVEVRITNTLPTEIDSASAAGTRGNGIALANVRARLSLLHDLQAHLTARTLKDRKSTRLNSSHLVI